MDLRASSATRGVAACIDLPACDALPGSADDSAILGMPQLRGEACHDLSAEAAGVAPAGARSPAELMQSSHSEPGSHNQDGNLQQSQASRPVVLGLQHALEHAGARQKPLQDFQEAVERSQMEQECSRGLPEAAAPLEAHQIPSQALQEASEGSQACHKGQGSPATPSVAPDQSAAGFRPIKGVLTEVSQQPPAELESLPGKACCAGASLLQPGASHMPPAWQQGRHSLSTAGLFVSAPAKRRRM